MPQDGNLATFVLQFGSYLPKDIRPVDRPIFPRILPYFTVSPLSSNLSEKKKVDGNVDGRNNRQDLLHSPRVAACRTLAVRFVDEKSFNQAAPAIKSLCM